jgi:hypothetical protein
MPETEWTLRFVVASAAMLALARWCSDHRRAVVALWIVVLIAILGGWRTAGSRYANNFSLGNTDSRPSAAAR